MHKDGEKLFYGPSHASDSRYRGVHVFSQGRIERVYIRDLLRHRVLVERGSIIDGVEVESVSSRSHPIRAHVKNVKTAEGETIEAKFLVGAEGAASSLRKQLGIPFDGSSTDIHWAVMDCKLETDYPYITTFG